MKKGRMTKSNHQNSEDFVPEYEQETDLSEYSPIAQEIIRNRVNLGTIAEPDLVGAFRGCCGDSIQIELRLDGDVIKQARFTTDGCSATVAVGGMITRLITDVTLDQARKVSAQEIIDALEGLPKWHRHCADLAVKTLQKTLQAKNEPESSI
jgi:NifU-like protein involved in Fe-S cluster formation